MTNAELIATLRGENYFVTLLHDAADALEAADKRIADYTAAIDALDDSNDAYIKENERLKKRIEELERNFSDVCNANGSLACERNKLLNDVRELEAQIPKDGEWIWENYCWHCSVCGENPTRGMGYVQGKSELFRVCPNCGANMQTVTDCHALDEKERGEQE